MFRCLWQTTHPITFLEKLDPSSFLMVIHDDLSLSMILKKLKSMCHLPDYWGPSCTALRKGPHSPSEGEAPYHWILVQKCIFMCCRETFCDPKGDTNNINQMFLPKLYPKSQWCEQRSKELDWTESLITSLSYWINNPWHLSSSWFTVMGSNDF